MISSSVNRSINKQLYTEARNPVKNFILEEFDDIKKEMIRSFENHPVTRELDAGPKSSNISKTLSKGNLFSFIGFDAGEKPTEVIRQSLHNSRIVISKGTKGTFNFDFFLPNMEELFKSTPLPWANGRSWLKGIEQGMSGLGRYLYSENLPTSRSGTGIQVKGSSGGRFRNVSYMSAILRSTKRKLEKIRQ
tara:strand:- start:2402 stop:2974 length:573 start_codon:yes stop_codon:yes gene_type:complete